MFANDDELQSRPVLQEVFCRVCQREPERDAVVFIDGQSARRYSYAQLYHDATQLARHLVEYGLKPGEHVAVWMPNCYEWVVTRFGVALAQLVLVPLNTRLRRDDLAQILGSSDARVLVTAESFGNIDYLQILRSIGVLAHDGPVRRPGSAPLLDLVISVAPKPAAGLRAFSDFLKPTSSSVDTPVGSPADVLNIIFTSGTTSLPKGVVVLNGAATHNLLRINERWGLRSEDRFLLSAPLFTSAGLGRSTATLLGGATLVLQEGFDARQFILVARTERITATALSDTNVLDLVDLLRHASADSVEALQLRVVLGLFSAGADSKHKFLRERLGVSHVLSHYGLSETSHMTSLASTDDAPDMADQSVGRPLPEVDVSIVDESTGEACARGEVGEIRVRGYITTPGYYKQPEATRGLFDEQGRLKTGDLGWLDTEGFVHFQSRLKDIIRVGGFNVTAGEIETLLRSQAEIREAAVVAVPDARLGEVPCAFVQFTGGNSLSAEQLHERLKGGVATYKLPRHLFAVDEWPRTGSEKIQKAALLESALSRLAQQGVAV